MLRRYLVDMRFSAKKLLLHVAAALIALVLLVTLLLPWLIYRQGLANFKTMPDFSQMPLLTAAQHDVVLAEFKLKETPVITPQSPYTKLLQFYQAERDRAWWQSSEARTEQLVSWVARCHAQDNLLKTRTMMWHISGAAMSVWLHNNTTSEQILAKAWTCLIRNRAFAARHHAIIMPDVPEDQPP